jgi:hypothetical protein
VASSADGAKLFAAIGRNTFTLPGTYAIWTSQFRPVPQLNLTLTNGIKCAWTIPSTNFVLQQASDISRGDWTDVTNAVGQDFPALQNEVIVSATNNVGFFRLEAR